MSEESNISSKDKESKKVTVCLVYGKEKFSVETTLDEPVVEFKRKVEKLTGTNT